MYKKSILSCGGHASPRKVCDETLKMKQELEGEKNDGALKVDVDEWRIL